MYGQSWRESGGWTERDRVSVPPVYEHMNAAEAAEAFFREYNQKNAEHMMTAPEGVGYCLAVKK